MGTRNSALDQTMYLVVSERPEGPIIYEIELRDMGLVKVTQDIMHGQYGPVLHVIEIDPVRHICNEVTHVFKEVIDLGQSFGSNEQA